MIKSELRKPTDLLANVGEKNALCGRVWKLIRDETFSQLIIKKISFTYLPHQI